LARTICSFLGSGWPIPPSLVLLLTLYSQLSTSQQPHCSPEDEGSMLLWNVDNPEYQYRHTELCFIFHAQDTKDFYTQSELEKLTTQTWISCLRW
jgi:hypothetical protein